MVLFMQMELFQPFASQSVYDVDRNPGIVSLFSDWLFQNVCHFYFVFNSIRPHVYSLSRVIGSGYAKDYKIGICYFSTKHTALRRKNKDWLAQNQDNDLIHSLCESWYKILFILLVVFLLELFTLGGLCNFKTVGFSRSVLTRK